MFENFPYTDMHQLNLDWIIKIAKDFLDQYTHIQQLIADGEESLQNLTTEGLQQLQDKADNLESLLNAWYTEHSSDIANQLADALEDLNDWYTEHEAFLNQYVSAAIVSFRDQAEAIAASVIETIPDDYTALSNKANETKDETDSLVWDLAHCVIRNRIDKDTYEEGYYSHGNPSTIGHGGNTKYLPKIRIRKGLTYSFHQIYGYFSAVVYDDESVVSLAASASPATINYTLSATKDGYAYVTINNGYYDTAMVIEGYTMYNGAYFEGSGSVLKTFAVNSITPYNYTTYLPKLANALDNTVYKLITTQAMTVSGTMTDVPDILKDANQHVSVLFNIGFVSSIPGTQILIVDTGEIYRRHVSAETNPPTFTNWVSYTADMFHMPYQVISPNNYATLLPSLDNAAPGFVYTFISTTAMAGKNGGLWASVPGEMERQQCIGAIATIGKAGYIGTTQVMFLTNIGKIYLRYLNDPGTGAVWTRWISYGNTEIHIAKDGTGDYTTLTEGLAEAIKIPDCHVYVHEGTYDIIEEYTALYGASFFLNYTQNETNVGLTLANNVIVEFYPNAFVECVYTGSNQYVQNKFSAFNSGAKGFTLINANIKTRNIRYAMHDERASADDYYHNSYINCYINHDKLSGSGYAQCIGGGLGKHGLIDIENCIFENPSNTGYLVSWHNAHAGDAARSVINIKNSIVKGDIRFSYYGVSTLVSTMMICGCKMYHHASVTQESQDYSTVNVEIKQFNNELGTF